MGKKQGNLICFEGIDGSGKTTQVDLLSKYLKDKNISYEVISFPRYGENIYANLVTRYLEGELGSINEVNPYLIALSYAGDRALAKPLIENWLNERKVVIANRYVSASKAHLGANLSKDEREEFINWLDELEYETNKIPKEDVTVLLNVDPKVGQENVLGKHQVDIHEESLKHLEDANKIYLELSQKEKNWVVVNCMEEGKMKSAEKIHREIISTNIPT